MGNCFRYKSIQILQSSTSLSPLSQSSSPSSSSSSPSKRSFFIWNKNECCICLDNKPNILLLPCKHIIICYNCHLIYNKNICPGCSTKIESRNIISL